MARAAWLPLLLAGAARAAGEARRCPREGGGLRSSEGGREVKATFISHVQEPLDLIWLDRDSNERLLNSIEPHGWSDMTTFSGHVWRARANGRLVWEAKLGPESQPQLHIDDCNAKQAELSLEEKEAVQESQRWLKKHGHRNDQALRDCPLAALLSEEPQQGLHVMCVVGETRARRLCIFEHGFSQPSCTHSVRLKGMETLEQVTTRLKWELRVRPLRPQAPHPALFTASGRRLPLELSLADAGVPEYRRAFVLVEGGVWHWPPVRVGFVRPLRSFVHSGLGGITLRTLSLKPRILEVKSFIEDSECKRILDLAGPKVRKSQVSLKDGDHGKDAEDWRTSKNYFLPSNGDAQLEALDERVQNLTRVPIIHSEYAQILRYDYWGRYTAHHDFFEPRDYSRDARTLELIGHGAFNRLLTVFMYMSDVEEGGETVFPSYLGSPPPMDFGDCSKGYKVRPERQKVIIFYNMHPNGDLDPHSLHGGCRVLNGTKWSANFWVWNVPRSFKAGQSHIKMSEQLDAWDPASDRREEAAVTELAAANQLGEATLEL